jgi:sirohydrochlorin ferrochelatase
MSGTRSPSPKAPRTEPSAEAPGAGPSPQAADAGRCAQAPGTGPSASAQGGRRPEALIVAHGQPSAPLPAEAALARLALRVGALAPGLRVTSATMAEPGALERALAQAARPPVIFPMFMSDGWFTARALPARLKGAAAAVLPPLGRADGLPALADALIARETAARGWATERVTLVLAAHGSARNPEPARAARDFAAALAGLIPLAAIRIGFVEEAPALAEAAAGAAMPALCLPFFACAGGHVREDVPEALAEAGFAGPLLPALGEDPAVAGLIAAALLAATAAPAALDTAPPRAAS